MQWDNLSRQLPERRRCILAETPGEVEQIISFAGLETKPNKDPIDRGFDPAIYRKRETPVVFSLAISQLALHGMEEAALSAIDAPRAALAQKLLQKLALGAGSLPAAA